MPFPWGVGGGTLFLGNTEVVTGSEREKREKIKEKMLQGWAHHLGRFTNEAILSIHRFHWC